MLTSLTDPRIFVLPGEPMPPPQLVSSLVTRLRLEDAGRVEQETVIRAWLIDNEPTPALARSLDRHGFGHLLVDRSTA